MSAHTRIVASVVACLSLAPLVGCASLTPAGFPAELSDAARQISVSTMDQAVWTRLLARLDGQIIEPGMEGYAGVLYVAGGKLRGVSGQLRIEGEGDGAGALSDEARAAIVDLAKRPDLLAKLLAFVEAVQADAVAADVPGVPDTQPAPTSQPAEPTPTTDGAEPAL